jgi:hypothetical protein
MVRRKRWVNGLHHAAISYDAVHCRGTMRTGIIVHKKLFFLIAVSLSKCASVTLPAPVGIVNLSLFPSSIKLFLDHALFMNNNNNNYYYYYYCNWVVTQWQWLFYMYAKHEIGYY